MIRRLLRALRAFRYPGISDAWPGVLLLSGGQVVHLQDPRDEAFFAPGMTIQLTSSDAQWTSPVEVFWRRKGRREAFADAWAGRS